MDWSRGADENDARGFPAAPDFGGGNGQHPTGRGTRLIGTMRYIWVRGPEVPDDVEEDGTLTPEDQWDLTLEHIGRTSDVIGTVRILKRG